MSRPVLQVFEEYQKSRVHFVQTIADLATRPQNIDALQNAGVMALLRPLLLDSVPAIQQSAALALGRLANYSEELAESVVTAEILPQLVYSLNQPNKFYKKAGSFVLRSIAKHSPVLAQSVVDSGGLISLINCLEEFDASVCESATWALGYISMHNSELAECVVNNGALPLLINCLKQPEISLKRIVISTLSDIAKHNSELAQTIVDTGALLLLSKELQNSDVIIKRNTTSCLSQIAKHSIDLAEAVTDSNVFPTILYLIRDGDAIVGRNSAACVREIVKHSAELCKLVINSGGASVLVDFIQNNQGKHNSLLPAVVAIGYIASFSETLALSIIISKGVGVLVSVLEGISKDGDMGEREHVIAAVVWSLSQLGRHSSDHAKAVVEFDVLRKIVGYYIAPGASEDLKVKAKRALKTLISNTTHLPSLESILTIAPYNILKYVAQQLAKVLSCDVNSKRAFVRTGGLKILQALNPEPGSDLKSAIDEVAALYPIEVINYFSPNYSETLLKKIDEFTPA